MTAIKLFTGLFLCLFIISIPAQAGPRLVKLAQKYEGLHERSNFRAVKAVVGHNPRSTPWCGSFACAILQKGGYACPASPLRAKSYLGVGKRVSLRKARRGDLVVFRRGSGGHVGFFAGWRDKNHMYLVSGNDGNEVRTSLRSTRGVIGVRRVGNRFGVAVRNYKGTNRFRTAFMSLFKSIE